MSLIRKHVAVLQAWACLALVFIKGVVRVCRGKQVLFDVTMVGLTNDKHCLVHNLRVEKHCRIYERIMKMFPNN